MLLWLRRAYGISILALVALTMFLASWLSSTAATPDNCEMVWMYESYATLAGFNSRYSRMGSKYQLLYYREGNGIDVDTQPQGIPVLFIPGNAGSYRQVRSLASFCSTTAHANSSLPKLDFFTADFKEDFTAFHGRTLLDQAEYLNDAIEYILSLYPDSEDVPAPSSVIVIGHSMGGIVARTLLTLPNYVEASINTIITFATPHVAPPLSFDRDLVLIYEKVNQFWRLSSSDPLDSRSPLHNVALISITGGRSDNMVPSDLTSVSSLVYPSHGFTTFTYSIPGVWTGIDHLAIVWCGQLRTVIGNALYDIVDPTSGSRTKSLKSRMEALAGHFLSELDRRPLEYHEEERKSLQGYNKFKHSKAHYDERFPITKNLSIPFTALSSSHETKIWLSKLGAKPSDESSFHKLSLEDTNASYIGILTNVTDLDGISIFLCEDPADDVQSTTPLYDFSTELLVENMSCYDVKNYVNVKLPASLLSSKLPSDNYAKQDGMTFYFLDPKFETKHNFKNILVYDGIGEQSPSFLEVAPIDMDFISVRPTFSTLLFGKEELILPSALYQDVSMEFADTALLSYKIKLTTDDSWCRFDESNFFSPMIRQYIPDPLEAKYHVNANGRQISVYTHGPISPYVPHKLAFFGENLHLQIFSPPVWCPQGVNNENIRLEISIDKWGSLANVVMRYRTLLATFPYAVTLVLFLTQLHTYNSKGDFPPLADVLQHFINIQLVEWIFGLVFLYILLGTQIVRQILRRFELMYDPKNDAALLFFNAYMPQNELFLGLSDMRFSLLGPIFIVISAGLVALLHYAVLSLERVLALSYKKLMLRRYKMASNQSAVPWIYSVLETPPQKGPMFVLAALAMLAFLYLIPYQVLFIALATFHIVYIVPRSIVALDIPSDRSRAQNNYHFNLSIAMIFSWQAVLNGPFLVVWLHNLSWKWTVVFATYHNITSSLPQLCLVILLATGRIIPCQSKIQAQFSFVLISFIIFYAIMFGSTKAYMMHHLLGFLCFWFLVVYGDNRKSTLKHLKDKALYPHLSL